MANKDEDKEKKDNDSKAKKTKKSNKKDNKFIKWSKEQWLAVKRNIFDFVSRMNYYMSILGVKAYQDKDENENKKCKKGYFAKYDCKRSQSEKSIKTLLKLSINPLCIKRFDEYGNEIYKGVKNIDIKEADKKKVESIEVFVPVNLIGEYTLNKDEELEKILEKNSEELDISFNDIWYNGIFLGLFLGGGGVLGYFVSWIGGALLGLIGAVWFVLSINASNQHNMTEFFFDGEKEEEGNDKGSEDDEDEDEDEDKASEKDIVWKSYKEEKDELVRNVIKKYRIVDYYQLDDDNFEKVISSDDDEEEGD